MLHPASQSPAVRLIKVKLYVDPLVKEAFEHFYDLDYPGAVSRLERFRQMHPGDPQASALIERIRKVN